MAMINCKECGKEISDKAISCPKCGVPLKEEVKDVLPVNLVEPKKEKSKTPLIVGIVGGVFVVLVLLAIFLNREDKVVCTSYLSNNVGWYDLYVEYEFEDDVVSFIKGEQTVYLNNVSDRNSLWEVSNKDQDQYNHYDGMTYKATLSEDGRISLNYSLEIQKAPKMFEVLQTVSSVEGLNEYSTREDVIRIYENKGFSCEG